MVNSTTLAVIYKVIYHTYKIWKQSTVIVHYMKNQNLLATKDQNATQDDNQNADCSANKLLVFQLIGVTVWSKLRKYESHKK